MAVWQIGGVPPVGDASTTSTVSTAPVTAGPPTILLVKPSIAAWFLLLVATAFAACGDEETERASGTDDDGTDECGGCAIPRCDDPGPCDCGCVEGQIMCVDGMDHVCTSQACFASENVPCGEGSTTATSSTSTSASSSSSGAGGAAAE